jgi:hypothetical protein
MDPINRLIFVSGSIVVINGWIISHDKLTHGLIVQFFVISLWICFLAVSYKGYKQLKKNKK